MIQNPTRLNLSKSQVQLRNDEGEHTLPLEDIAAIVLESPAITLTSALLSQAMEQGVAVMTCDDAHTPNGVLLPFLAHSRQGKMARLQLSWSEPLRKRLWQRIVQAKIANQALCLAACKGEGEAAHLRALAKRVQSGDPNNLEAQAARDYWPRLFGGAFLRSGAGGVNAALNYGYAVIRAFVARSQVAYGLLPAFGLHHESEMNAFNLTDDLMEPLRPLADALVFALREEGALQSEMLGKQARQRLVALGAAVCLLDGQKQTLMNACDRMSAGLASAIEGKSAALLPLPEFTPFT
jgi:CRISPR-associated protein Cas1